MQNLFDSANYPDGIPAELVAGSRWGWTRSDITAAYPTDTYTLVYKLEALADPYGVVTLTAGKTGDVHTIEAAASATDNHPAGDYTWRAIVVRDSDSDEALIDGGFVTIAANDLPASGSKASWVYQTLIAIRATLQNTASDKQAAYSVGGRSLSLRSPTELLEMEREFSQRWEAEKRKADRAAGRTVKSRVLVKMSA